MASVPGGVTWRDVDQVRPFQREIVEPDTEKQAFVLVHVRLTLPGVDLALGTFDHVSPFQRNVVVPTAMHAVAVGHETVPKPPGVLTADHFVPSHCATSE